MQMVLRFLSRDNSARRRGRGKEESSKESASDFTKLFCVVMYTLEVFSISPPILIFSIAAEAYSSGATLELIRTLLVKKVL